MARRLLQVAATVALALAVAPLAPASAVGGGEARFAPTRAEDTRPCVSHLEFYDGGGRTLKKKERAWEVRGLGVPLAELPFAEFGPDLSTDAVGDFVIAYPACAYNRREAGIFVVYNSAGYWKTAFRYRFEGATEHGRPKITERRG